MEVRGEFVLFHIFAFHSVTHLGFVAQLRIAPREPQQDRKRGKAKSLGEVFALMGAVLVLQSQ